MSAQTSVMISYSTQSKIKTVYNSNKAFTPSLYYHTDNTSGIS